MKRILMVAALAALAGCASSGPVPIGKDTYLINKRSAGGGFVSAGSVKVDVIREAHAFCGTQGKVFQIVNTNEISSAPGRLPSAEVQFMCLDDGDHEINRPKLSPRADTVIEVRN